MNIINRCLISAATLVSLCCLGCSTVSLHEINTKYGFPGVYLDAWSVAYSDFMTTSEMSKAEKELKKYNIELYKEGDDIIVFFHPYLLSKKEMSKQHRAIIGMEVQYWINAKTLKISKRLFYKQ